VRILGRADELTPIAGNQPPVRVAAPAARPGQLRDLVTLLRPHQWLKNLLVVPLPLIDASTWTLSGVWRLCWAVAVFILASALVYVGNDAADRNRDRAHPVKRLRPIASGRVSLPAAGALAVLLAVALAALLSTQPYTDWWPVLTYLVLNVAYSRGLKHVPLLDVITVALGFELRLAQGYVAIGQGFSTWLPVCVLGLCLLLILGKRRNEMTAGGDRHRPALRGYSVPYLDQLLGLTAALVCAAFLMYVHTEAPLYPYRTAATLASAPFAMLALFRYLQVVIVRDGGGDPVRSLVRDPVMAVNALLWTVVLGSLNLFARYPHAIETLFRKAT
jgi:4-hydroxybenzoate polyprenyltransferase